MDLLPNVLGVPDPQGPVGGAGVELVIDDRHAVDGALVALEQGDQTPIRLLFVGLLKQ
jgi:hypothetical protein